MINGILNHQIFRYLLVGGLANALGFVIYSTAVWSGLFVEVAVILSFMVAIPIAFVLNKTWIFRSNTSWIYGFIKYVTANFLILLTQIVLISIFVRILLINEFIAYILGVGITVIMSFLILKFIIFAKK